MTTFAAGSKPGIPSSTHVPAASLLSPSDTFIDRHIGPSDEDVASMLRLLGYDSLDAFSDAVVPASIRLNRPLQLTGAAATNENSSQRSPRGEFELLAELRQIAGGNKVMRSCIGMGYHDCITPAPILRNILENPGWYTQYTPYQAEISQGRLESLLNFQTMIADLTALPMANASLLDEGTAAAEAMAMCHAIAGGAGGAGGGGDERKVFFISDACHPQTINVVRTRARSMGIELRVGNFDQLLTADGAGSNAKAQGLPSLGFGVDQLCGALVQYPDTFGRIEDPARLQQLADALHAAGALFVVACDPLALTLIKPPGEFGADIAIGSAQRFGVPMGGGGPHAAFMATTKEHVRKMPGRIVGVSRDTHGNPAYRLAIQTREQHIRREKATSNICTAQVLLANIAAMYAVYHGPAGLKQIARRVHRATAALAEGIRREGHELLHDTFFDALAVRLHPRGLSSEWRDRPADAVIAVAAARGINLRKLDEDTVAIALDETVDRVLIYHLLDVLAFDGEVDLDPNHLVDEAKDSFGPCKRTSSFLTHPVFNTHHSEHELVRYMRKLESRDLSLTTSMISLGSCTMKLNGTSEMFPVTWPEFGRIHPFAPREQLAGYAKMCGDLEKWLAQITGFAAVSLQPNAGSQGEYAGLLAIRAYHESRGQGHRNICLIPVSAHGTNPASAVIAGFHVVTVECDKHGNVDLTDLRAKADEHKDDLACLMITYPSTHGVFEADVKEICRCVHDHGGQVYMDGANMNAQVGLTSPGHIGADVCHLNLHKTFCIPHGGGGPGMGPIGVAGHLAPFLPSDPLSLEGEGWGEGENSRKENGNVTGSNLSANVARNLAGGSDPHPSPLPKREREPEGTADASTRNPKSEIRNPKSSPSPRPVSAAPWGSASILPISWVYIALMGGTGLKKATQVAILNANYMARRLSEHYPVLFTAKNGTVAHEFIIDCRQFEASSGVKVEDIAKRLMDYGFHAPTMSFPVPGTLMIEPTESEPRAELDRFVDALIAIRGEIRAIEQGKLDRADNPLKHAPHTAPAVIADAWPHKYSREQAAYPAPWLRDHKFWPYVGRIDNPWGDRNLFCACPPVNG